MQRQYREFMSNNLLVKNSWSQSRQNDVCDSVTKLPVLYYVQKKIDQEEYLTEGLQYIDKVNRF